MLPYVEEAIKTKKWAFASDYVRLYVLAKYGGIYMDTDVELVKKLDDYLNQKAFVGFDSNSSIATCLMACEKRFPFFKSLLDDYNHRHFIKEDNSLDETTNVKVITDKLLSNGLILNNKRQIVDGLTLYPQDYFSPKDYESKRLNMTDDMVAIHHFDGSWIDEYSKNMRRKLYYCKNHFKGPFIKLFYYLWAFPDWVGRNRLEKKTSRQIKD